MPICVVCNSSQFACQDGKFFCMECDTQSQDFVDEQTSEVTVESFTTRQLRKKISLKNTSDKGLPWNTVEGFQLILREHIKALIDMGFPPRLRDVMKQVWFKYVQKSGLATIDRNQESGEKKERFRDFFLRHYKDEILPSHVTRIVNLRLSKHCRSAKKGQSLDQLQNDEEWFSVDTGLSSDDEDCAEEKIRFAPISRCHTLNLMSTMKIICFCYISLQWCREPVTVGDLLLWIELHYLPYYGAADCFLPHMKLTGEDYQTLSNTRPLRYDQVVLMSDALVKYLEMPALPEVDIMQLVSRYIVQLNLPTSLMPLISKLSKKVTYSRSAYQKVVRRKVLCSETRVHGYCPDLIAAGLITVALKLIFVLNDNVEWTNDSKTCEIHEESESQSCKKFTWTSWVKAHITYQEHKLQRDCSLFDKDLKDAGDVHKCMETFLELMIRNHKVHSRTSENNEKMIQNTSEVFQKVVKQQGSAEEKNRQKELRKSYASSYKRLGFLEGSTVDLTDACIIGHLRKMNKREDDLFYVQYEPPISDCLIKTKFHQSYSYLLEILSELTYADATHIHSAVQFVEFQTVRNRKQSRSAGCVTK